MQAAKPLHYDLIIVGGGLVGASLALALRETALNIALVEARLPSANDARLFALNISSVNLLKHIGVWSHIQTHASPIHHVHVSQRGHFGAVNLSAEEAGLDELGQVLPACHLEAALHEALLQAPHLTLYRPAQLTQMATDDTLILTQHNETIALSAPLIIGADGTESTLRELLSIPTETIDYHQTAIVSRIQIARAHQGVAYERFCDGGALAMLPLPNNECASILSVDTAKAKSLLALDNAAYLAHCQQLMGHRLGRFLSVSERQSYPLRMKRALRAVTQNVFLLGNALHTLHPIAAQGFNLALYEVACLVEGMQKINGRLSAADLARISEHTEQQQRASITVSDKLARFFSKPQSALSCLAGLSMAGLDCLPPLKKHFISIMTGRAGTPPALLASNQE
ncbi:MAG TPA: FAD-dependent monooxygenase [Gammaproteobacteria bacterium]|nr:FAD-dependent monooxygenase [Gammaproteobacteria bacterium]